MISLLFHGLDCPKPSPLSRLVLQFLSNPCDFCGAQRLGHCSICVMTWLPRGKNTRLPKNHSVMNPSINTNKLLVAAVGGLLSQTPHREQARKHGVADLCLSSQRPLDLLNTQNTGSMRNTVSERVSQHGLRLCLRRSPGSIIHDIHPATTSPQERACELVDLCPRGWELCT